MPTYQFNRPLFVADEQPSDGFAAASRKPDVPYATVPRRPVEYYRDVLDDDRPHALTVACLVVGLLVVLGTMLAALGLIFAAIHAA